MEIDMVGEEYEVFKEGYLAKIKAYTEKLGLTFDDDGCHSIWEEALAGESVESAVWYYLDTYEGISHDADPEFWKGRE